MGHPEQSLPDMGRADPRSAQIGGRVGIAQSFQVSAYSIDPEPASRARNLFPKDDCRAAVADEPAELRPKVTRVRRPEPFPGDTERLAGATPRPDRSLIRPTGEPERVGPTSNPGKKVALHESDQVAWFDIINTPFIHGPWSDQVGADQLPQPSRRLRIILVIVVQRASKMGSESARESQSENQTGIGQKPTTTKNQRFWPFRHPETHIAWLRHA